MTKPTDFTELSALLQEKLPHLPAAQQRLAQVLLEDPEGAAFRTAAELADKTGVNAATVVRFATSLGFAGYPDMVSVYRRHLREQARLVHRFSELKELDEKGADLRALHAAQEEANLIRTLSRIDEADWSAGVSLLAKRKQVIVIGARKAFAVSYLLSYLLGMARPNVRHATGEPGTFPDSLRGIDSDALVVGISINPYSQATEATMRYAKRHGAATIAITDNAASPLVRNADVSYYCAIDTPTVMRSVTALVSLVQGLVNAVALDLGDDAERQYARSESLVRELHLYIEDEDET